MQSFEFCYLNADGSLACALSACCADEKQAKILAHAMKLSHTKCFEVWMGEKLVYARPTRLDEPYGALAAESEVVHYQRSNRRATSAPAKPTSDSPSVKKTSWNGAAVSSQRNA